MKKPSVHFAEVLEAVKEYNVSGTSSSEDSAESDDLERLPTTAEGTVWCQSEFFFYHFIRLNSALRADGVQLRVDS